MSETSIYFVTYKPKDSSEAILKFHCVDDVWKWVEEFIGTNGRYPNNLTVFKAKCLFDGSL